MALGRRVGRKRVDGPAVRGPVQPVSGAVAAGRRTPTIDGVAAPYLVLFVADAADDGHADALREVVRQVPGAGFFDDPADTGVRTVGAFLRTDDPAGEGATLVYGVAAFSLMLAARIEVQYREEILGWIVDGRPDPDLTRALGLRDIPESQ